MKNTVKKYGIVLFLFGFILLPSLGCRKKKDTIVNITVKDVNSARVPEALVSLEADPTVPGATVDPKWENFNTISDGSGVASFNLNEIYKLGQAGVAVASIRASKDGAAGQGVIKIEEEIVNEATVFI
jgi:hypothetical protein